MSALFLSCLVFGVITQVLLQSVEAQIKYTITRLAPILGDPGPNGVASSPSALNAQGDVVGYYAWRDGTDMFFLTMLASCTISQLWPGACQQGLTFTDGSWVLT
jgi:hypothetical protein